ncbi:MAG: hypothetical protein ACE5HP_12630, partial [Gemmatimonadota bacterium]
MEAKATRAALKPSPVALLLAVGCLLTACAQESPTALDAPAVFAAKGGNGGGGGPTVDATDPTGAPQGATLPVRVLGSRFEPGSVVDFLLDGKKTDKVKTNSTSFVDAGELVADVTIAIDAPVDAYDVRVTTPRKKKGIGIELFNVEAEAVIATVTDPSSDGSVPGVYADGLGDYGPDDGTTIRFRLRAQCDSPTGRRETFLVLPG